MTPIVTTRALTKQYGELTAVSAVDLHVEAGEIYGFLGANGSGKTTTLRMLLGLVLPTSGEIEVFGEPMPAARASVLPRIGALVEGPGAYPHLSGWTNLALLDASGPDRRRGNARAGRIAEVLDQVGLDPVDKRPVRAYSLGMKQRLGLAMGLFRRPDLLILDEPTNGLDPEGMVEIRKLILTLNSTGTTVILSSHLLSEIEQVCTRVGVLERGRLVLQERLDVVLGEPDLVAVRTVDADRCAELLGATVAERDGDRLVIRTEDASALNAHLVRAGVRVAEIGPYRRSLSDVVLRAVRTR